MYCKHCGKEIPENSEFCRYCGNQLSTLNKAHVVVEKVHQVSPEKVEYADFRIRLGAYIIDFLGMCAGAFGMGALFGYLFEEDIVNALPDIFWSYFSYVIYSTFSLTIWSTTFGKYLYGLNVATEDNDESLTFGRSLKRSLLQPLSTLFFCVGYWNMEKNPKNQAWHDKSARTVVVRKQRSLVLAYIVTFIALITWVYLAYWFE